MSFLDRFFGPTYDKELKKIRPLVTKINALEESYKDIPTEELPAKVAALKEKVKKHDFPLQNRCF